jgi:RHS repeat-associated protein
MVMPNRNDPGSSDYRYSFQGQEKDDEIKGEGNSINYKYRMHDPRVGRFFAVDPLNDKYPSNSPYSFSENDVIRAIELEGLEKYIITKSVTKGQGGIKVRTKIQYVKAADRKESSPGAGDQNREVDYIVNGSLTSVHKIPKNTWEYEQIRRKKATMDEYGQNAQERTLEEATESGANVVSGEFTGDPTMKGRNLVYWGNISIEDTYNDFKIFYDTNDDVQEGQGEREALEQTADILALHSEVQIRIIGYTSRQGDSSTNMDLSKRRAERIKKEILKIAKEKGYNVQSIESRISITPLGESRSKNDDGTDDPKERKVYIQFK